MKSFGRVADSIYTGIIGAVTATLVAAILRKIWTKTTGSAPPDLRDPQSSARATIIWAGLSGLGAGIARVLTSRVTSARQVD